MNRSQTHVVLFFDQVVKVVTSPTLALGPEMIPRPRIAVVSSAMEQRVRWLEPVLCRRGMAIERWAVADS